MTPKPGQFPYYSCILKLILARNFAMQGPEFRIVEPDINFNSMLSGCRFTQHKQYSNCECSVVNH